MFYNDQTFDNAKTLKQFEIPIDTVEDKTGLVFNFKSAISGSLVDYDPKGTNTTKETYDTDYYTNMLLTSDTVEGMNGARSRAEYPNRIDLNVSQYEDQINKVAA